MTAYIPLVVGPLVDDDSSKCALHEMQVVLLNVTCESHELWVVSTGWQDLAGRAWGTHVPHHKDVLFQFFSHAKSVSFNLVFVD
jgi:hypothetical protein